MSTTPKRDPIISDAAGAGSTDWTGDSITAEQDEVVSRILEQRPELHRLYSRCQIYRTFQRGEIKIGDET